MEYLGRLYKSASGRVEPGERGWKNCRESFLTAYLSPLAPPDFVCYHSPSQRRGGQDMAEEESGFTFVDKRRAAAEEPPAEAPQLAGALAEDISASEPDLDNDGGEGTPDIYSVLGYCLSILAGEAWQKLGLMADPKTGEAAPDLEQAKVAIDAVGDLAARLEAAPAEFVPDTLRRDLKTLLNDLRLNYVGQRNLQGGLISPS